MPSIRAKRFVRKIVENYGKPKPESLGQIVLSSGFGKSYKKTPSKLLKTKGVQELLIKAGLTNEKILNAWSEMALKKEPEDKFKWEHKLRALENATELAGLKEKDNLKNRNIKTFIDKFLYIGDTKEIEKELAEKSADKKVIE